VSIRVGIDWDNNGFICYGAKPTDPINVIPSALYWHGLTRVAYGTGSIVRDNLFWKTDDGLQATQFKTGADGTPAANGLIFGRDGASYEIPALPNTTYTFTVLLKGMTNFTDVVFQVQAYTDHQPTTYYTSNLSTVSDTAWTRFTGTITTSGSTGYIAFRVNKSDSSTDDSEIAVTGWMLVEGTTLPVFNLGDNVGLYEDITDYVLACQWRGGYSDWKSAIFAEGTASLTLDNQTRIFSPENSGSAVFGNMKQKLLVTIDYIDTVANPLWRGWVTSYGVSTGLSRNQQCSITCEQGRFRLDDLTYSNPLIGELTADTIIQDVLEKSHVSTFAPCQAVVGSSKVSECWVGYDGDTTLDDRFKIFDLDPGLTVLDIVGESWGSDTSATRAIENVLKVEHGWLAIERNGRIRFINRHAFDDVSPTALDLNTEANNSSYVYGDNFYNTIRLTYSPKSARTGKVWESREPTILKPNETGVKVAAQLEYEEGSKLTVLSVEGFEGTSSYTAVLHGGTKDYSGFVDIDVVLNNGEIDITVNNRSNRKVDVEITLYGEISESYGSIIYELEDVNQQNTGIYELPFHSSLITDEVQADNLAQYLLHIYSRQTGELISFNMLDKNTAWLSNILSLSFGSFVTLTEGQTSHTGEYIIIGEDGRYSPGYIDITHKLFPFARIDSGAVLGSSVIGSTAKVGY